MFVFGPCNAVFVIAFGLARRDASGRFWVEGMPLGPAVRRDAPGAPGLEGMPLGPGVRRDALKACPAGVRTDAAGTWG